MSKIQFLLFRWFSQALAMASMLLPLFTAPAVFYLIISSCFFCGKGQVEGGTGAGGGIGGGGAGYEDPPEIVAKALLCFNDKYIYSACEESWRLRESGNLGVPREKADEYCDGPCLGETHLVLDCIEGIFGNFLFYNRATLRDVRDTIHAACGYGPQRGNFDVTEHIRAEEGKASRASNHILVGLGFMILGLFTRMLV